jgi:hypothetical protein
MQNYNNIYYFGLPGEVTYASLVHHYRLLLTTFYALLQLLNLHRIHENNIISGHKDEKEKRENSSSQNLNKNTAETSVRNSALGLFHSPQLFLL